MRKALLAARELLRRARLPGGLSTWLGGNSPRWPKLGNTWNLAVDILREAAARRWLMGVAAGLTLLLLGLALTLNLTVVDGALTATRWLGRGVAHDIQAVEVLLRPVFRASTYAVFYGSLGFTVVACPDFAPQLLAPGRIEHLLSLPVRRAELLFGTLLGVMMLCALSALYAGGGLWLVLQLKAGTFSLLPVWGLALGTLGFFAVYSVMLATAVWSRSTPLSSAAGAATILLGVLASHRETLIAALEPGLGRWLVVALTAPLPRLSALADAAAALAGGDDLVWSELLRQAVGTLLFGLAVLSLGMWRLQRRDF